jgi:hypothetical protein
MPGIFNEQWTCLTSEEDGMRQGRLALPSLNGHENNQARGELLNTRPDRPDQGRVSTRICWQ